MNDKLVKCPFNPKHILDESSLQRHVIRCMVNYPNYVPCPYNALHRFENKDLLQTHMLVCESKEKTNLFFEVNDTKQEPTCFHIENTRSFNLKYENWDED